MSQSTWEQRLREPLQTILFLGLIGCLSIAGCGKSRSPQEIEKEQRSLDVLYLTAQSGKEITAPATKGIFVDPESGELCYPAYMCGNPNCPGKTVGDRPYLFIHRDIMLKAGPGGEIVRDPFPPGQDPAKYIQSHGGFLSPTCPACWELRKDKPETPAETQKFVEWVQPYVLPKTAERMKVLEQEYKSRAAEKATSRPRG